MKLFLRWFTVLALSLCAVKNPSNARTDVHPSSTCGPPAYCARTDRQTVAYPEKPPSLGPAGSVITDPNFGSRILRVTDARSDQGRPAGPLYTPSSAEQNSWNKNSTMFYVVTSGGTFLLYYFDPAKLAAGPARTPSLPWGPEPQFSYRQPNILYGINRNAGAFEQYDTSSGRVTEINTPSKCVKLGSGEGAAAVTVSADDNRFTAMLGTRQDEFRMVYVYDRTQGCRWYNTQTGEIGGQWGPKGTISVPDRFPLHNARMAKSGKFIYMTRGSGGGPGHGWLVWEIDTMNVGVCARACSGHHVLGYTHIIGSSGFVHPMDTLMWPLHHLEESKPLITGLEPGHAVWFDSHFSWNNVDPNDSTPVCFSTYQPTNPNTPGAPLLATGPWENEIDCAETDGNASKVWRFAHTYSTAKNGFWSTPRGNVSQDGKFFMFTSDWQDQLGKMPNGNQYRTDVFVVELK
jgi:hypothetical protein